MIVAVVSWHSTCPVVALYDPKQKKCTSLHRLKEDFFLETLEAVLKARKKISRLVILFGMERFSQTRQLTLFANVIAKEFSIKCRSPDPRNRTVKKLRMFT